MVQTPVAHMAAGFATAIAVAGHPGVHSIRAPDVAARTATDPAPFPPVGGKGLTMGRRQ